MEFTDDLALEEHPLTPKNETVSSNHCNKMVKISKNKVIPQQPDLIYAPVSTNGSLTDSNSLIHKNQNIESSNMDNPLCLYLLNI